MIYLSSNIVNILLYEIALPVKKLHISNERKNYNDTVCNGVFFKNWNWLLNELLKVRDKKELDNHNVTTANNVCMPGIY